ncbi:MAG: DUF5695 domain-containing protein, partial [Armatimonadetes bacterium]|nr:DUF5695 domain-containing protein [Armatimonadota bacterium]
MKLFELDARSPDAGGELWSGFRRVGSPTLRELVGQKAVFFNGTGDTYEHAAPAELCGARPRTIEVWAFKEAVRGDEETLIGWGRRGGPTATNIALNWGNNGAYGGATHWSADMGWHGTPKAGQWHHLVYTYDGKTARLYDNGAEKASMDIRLATPQGFPIRLAVQNAADGSAAFKNEYNGSAMSGPVGIALLRLHDAALSEAEVQTAFQADQERFKAVAPLTLAKLREGGVTKISVGGLTLTVSKSENKPLGLVADATGFDFLPTDRLLTRLGDGFHHLGDVLVRASGPVETKKEWLSERGHLVLRATVTNTGSSAVELGAVGFPVIFNNIISDRDLPQAHEKCVFFDPYIGQDAGYLRVTRLSGAGPALAVIPDGKTPFEAYQPLREPIGPSQTFEGAYAWLAHSAAYAEKDWGKATPWNVPSKATLAPGESRTYGLRFVLSESIRGLEKAIAAAGQPVVIGVPGFIVPQKSDAKLIVNYSKPVKSMTVEPAGALSLTPAGKTPAGWATYAVKATGWGRARLTLTYADGLTQTVHYWLTKPGRVSLHQAVVRKARRPVWPESVGDELRPRAQSDCRAGQPCLDRGPRGRRRLVVADRGDEALSPARCRTSREVRALCGRRLVGRLAVCQRPEQVRCEEIAVLLRPQGTPGLSLPQGHQLGLVDQLEQESDRRHWAGLQLPARG